MNRKSTYYLLAISTVMMLLSCSGPNPLPSLIETYSRTDKNPFGTYVAFRQVNEMFYRNDVRVKKEPFDKALEDNYNDTSALYICISEHFYLRNTERSSLLDFVKRGNSVFVSAKYFDTAFLNEMNVSVDETPFSIYWASPMQMKQTRLQLSAPPFTDKVSYGYYYMPLKNSVTVTDEDGDAKVLGVSEEGKTDFVVLFYGKGRVYLHCEPRAFSNYFLLKENNFKYLQRAFSFIPRVPDNIFWDDFYNRREFQPSENENEDESGNRSSFEVLFRYPAMKWAFWLVLLLLSLYLLFGSKRRQRIIKPVTTNENTSVAFTETVGRLYLQKKDNRNIADKMITYLLEHIRNQYFINTNSLNTEFTSMVTRKTSLPAEQVDKLFGIINKIQRSDVVEDSLLLSLNTQIENFYKHKS